MLIYSGSVNCVGSVCELVVLAVVLLFVVLMILVVVEVVAVVEVVTRFNKNQLNVKANRLRLCKVKK